MATDSFLAVMTDFESKSAEKRHHEKRVEKALMLKSPSDEVDGVADHVPTQALQERGRRVTFLGDFVVQVI